MSPELEVEEDGFCDEVELDEGLDELELDGTLLDVAALEEFDEPPTDELPDTFDDASEDSVPSPEVVPPRFSVMSPT